MTGVAIRIFLRYLSGWLIARGLLGAEDGSYLGSDPDVAALLETGVGLALGAATEGWYWLANKYGWKK